mgnify:CR=1 FL=1
MIHRPIHTEPYSKNSTKNRKYPESFLRNSPPLIDRFDLINTHNQIRGKTKNSDIVIKILHCIYLFMLFLSSELLYFCISYPPILIIVIFGNFSLMISSGTRWSYPNARRSGHNSRIGANISNSSPRITRASGNSRPTTSLRKSSLWIGYCHFPENTRWSRAITTVIESASFWASER